MASKHFKNVPDCLILAWFFLSDWWTSSYSPHTCSTFVPPCPRFLLNTSLKFLWNSKMLHFKDFLCFLCSIVDKIRVHDIHCFLFLFTFTLRHNFFESGLVQQVYMLTFTIADEKNMMESSQLEDLGRWWNLRRTYTMQMPWTVV